MKSKIILASIIFFILGSTITYALITSNLKQVTEERAQSSPTPKPLGYISGIKTTKGIIYLLIDQDHISFNPFETAVNNGTFITIEKEKYSKLFQQGSGNYSVFRTDEYTDPQTKEMFIKLSNSQPDHGGFASTFVLLVNPFTGEIKEGKNDYSNDN